MDPALYLLLPIPAATSFVCAGCDAPGAWHTADARITIVIEGVVAEFVANDVVPHISAGPGRQGIDFDEFVPCVPLDHANIGTGR